MTKEDFRVSFIFKIIIRICKKIKKIKKKKMSFVGKRLTFYSKIFCIFYLNKEELNQRICLIKYVEPERAGGAKT